MPTLSDSRRAATAELAARIYEHNLAFVERDAPPPPADLAWIREESRLNAERALDVVDVAAAARPRRVLEVGVGYLSLTTALRLVLGEGIELVGIEHPARAYLADPEFRRRLAEQRVELHLGDILAGPLPVAGESFDAVLFCDVIEHLPPPDVPTILERLAALLAPGGRLVVSSSNLPAFYRLAALAAGRGVIFDPPLPLAAAGGTYGHLRLYGRGDMEILLDHVGLELVEWRYLNWERIFIDRSTMSGRLAYWGQRVLPSVAPRFATSWVCAGTPRG